MKLIFLCVNKSDWRRRFFGTHPDLPSHFWYFFHRRVRETVDTEMANPDLYITGKCMIQFYPIIFYSAVSIIYRFIFPHVIRSKTEKKKKKSEAFTTINFYNYVKYSL